jgi:glutathione S-transferase
MAPEAERENFGRLTAERMFLNRLRLVSDRLERSPHLAGDDFTAADISVAYALDLGDRLGLAEKYPAVVSAYRDRLAARDAHARAIARDPPSTAPA